MDPNFVAFLGSRFLESVPNPPLTATLLGLGAGLTLYVLKIAAHIRERGRFDSGLWDRIVELVRQNRLRDASALCEIEEGLFPRLFKAGIDAARFSRQDSGESMTLFIHDGLSQFRRGFGVIAAASAIVLMTAIAMSGQRLTEHLSLLRFGEIAPLVEALLYIALPIMVASALLTPAVSLLVYCSCSMLRLTSRLNTYRLRLLVGLFERTSRAAANPEFKPETAMPAFIPDDELDRPAVDLTPKVPVVVLAPRASRPAQETDAWANVGRRS